MSSKESNSRFKSIYNTSGIQLHAQLASHRTDFSIGMTSGRTRKISRREILLISNHLISTESILSLAKHHLVLSYQEVAKEIAKHLSGKNQEVNTNVIEYYMEQSLNASIVFANSTIDYLQILLMLLYSSFTELEEIIPRQRVESRMQRNGVDKADWDVIFYSGLQNSFRDWFANNERNFPATVKKQYNEIESLNRTFKNNQANPLKHYGITTFDKTDKSNILRGNFSIVGIDEVYNDAIKTIVVGSRRSKMDLTDGQKLLISYLNKSIDLFNSLCKSIEIKPRL